MGSATSTINIRGEELSSSSSSSSSPSPDQLLTSPELLISGAIKALVCFSGCGDKSDAVVAACNQGGVSTEKKHECFKAAAALQKCIHDNAVVYESVLGEAHKQQEKSSQA